MRTRRFMAAVLIAFDCPLVLEAADKPNTLVIWGDNNGWQNVSAYGMGTMGYTTPNIDRLAGVIARSQARRHN